MSWWKHFLPATKKDVELIMSAISEYSSRVGTAFDSISTAVDGVVADVDFLKTKIQELQNTTGAITPEDQALLDAIEARASQIASKVQALDQATESAPEPPPANT